MKHYHLEGLGFELRGVKACDQFLAPIFSARAEELLVVALLGESCGLLQLLMFAGDKEQVDFNSSELFRQAIRAGAAGVILAHNHPSGDHRPSRSDKVLTRSIALYCEALEIQLIDHLIFGGTDVFSFRNAGLL